MQPEPGTARRGLIAWRNTASAMLPVWIGIPFLGSEAVKHDDVWQDLAFVLLTLVVYCAGVLVVIPVFALTVGRWLDRITAPRGLRAGVLAFGSVGAFLGLVLVMVLGLGGLTALGIAVVFCAPTLTAVAGRLLMEVRGRVWSVLLWVTFAAAIAVALAIVGTLLFSG